MITCIKCQASLVLSKSGLTKCLSCGAIMRVDLFPALFREPAPGISGQNVLVENEASCFYHPGKRAVIPCTTCGRFLCALCDVDFNGRHLCPVCLETGRRKRSLKDLENHRTLYDTIALYLATVPMLFFWPVIFTAPMVVFLTIRHWNAPNSIIPRTKIRFVVAFIFAVLQIVGWAGGIYLAAVH